MITQRIVESEYFFETSREKVFITGSKAVKEAIKES